MAGLLLTAAACTLQQPAGAPPAEPPQQDCLPLVDLLPEPETRRPPESVPEVLVLLDLATRVVESTTPEQRRGIVQTQKSEYDADPSYDNLLRLTMVRAFTAALPADLKEVRADLKVLANAAEELTDDQRRLALIALIMVDERLGLGEQILSLQQQIDSLTEIEASMNHHKATEPMEKTP